jgi:hypothetical protein
MPCTFVGIRVSLFFGGVNVQKESIMKNDMTSTVKKVVISGFTGLAIMASAEIVVPLTLDHSGVVFKQAQAEEDGDGGPKGGKGVKGSGGANAGGSGGSPGKGKGSSHVPGGPSEESDAKGPKHGGGDKKPEAGTKGGKPSWAKEGIPEVELGRLNVARSPSHVLDRALAEALKELDPALYNLPSLEAIITAIKTGKLPDGSELVRVDSPLANLALLKSLLLNKKIGDGTQIVVTDSNLITLAAVFLGSASDKTVPVTTDTVKAILIILGLENTVTEAQVSEIATGAEAVRAAILEAHG